MAIAVNCEHCGHSGRVGDNLYGKVVKCPKCGGHLQVGSPPASAPPPRPGSPLASPLGGAMDEDDGRPYQLSSQCPDCGSQMSPGAVICVKCGFDVRTGSKHTRSESPPLVPTYMASRASEYEERASPSRSTSGDGEGGMGNIFWFIMIFGVGNAILYYFTGIVIIPIRR